MLKAHYTVSRTSRGLTIKCQSDMDWRYRELGARYDARDRMLHVQTASGNHTISCNSLIEARRLFGTLVYNMTARPVAFHAERKL